MSNIGTIWVVVSASEAQRRLVEFIDSGYLAEATGFSQALDSLVNKMRSFVQQYGGSIPISLYERIVMQVPLTAAEQIPMILKGYSESLNNKVAVGMGLTLEEAGSAAKKSTYTGQIELFDSSMSNGDYYKSGQTSRRLSEGVVLPTNIFDPTVPDTEQYSTEREDSDNSSVPDIKTAMSAETELIQAVAQQLGGDTLKQQQQQMEQMAQQQQEAEQAGGRDLMESLNGGPVEGHEPEEEESSPDEAGDGEPKEKESQEDDEAEELVEEIEEAESITTDDKIAAQLDNIKGQIPQIMGLADSNPKAFKQTMGMIDKLIQLANSRQKATKKSESRIQIEELMKDINRRGKAASVRPLTHGIRFPVGTRLGRYRKVLVDGYEKWRELSSGQVQDDQTGSPVSIREHNRDKDKNDREIEEIE